METRSHAGAWPARPKSQISWGRTTVKEADLKQIEAVQVARRLEGNLAAASKLRQSISKRPRRHRPISKLLLDTNISQRASARACAVWSLRGGSQSTRDLMATAAVVRPMLGISPSAWEAARTVMGEIPAAIVVAAILQRGAATRARRCAPALVAPNPERFTTLDIT